MEFSDSQTTPPYTHDETLRVTPACVIKGPENVCKKIVRVPAWLKRFQYQRDRLSESTAKKYQKTFPGLSVIPSTALPFLLGALIHSSGSSGIETVDNIFQMLSFSYLSFAWCLSAVEF